MKLKSIFIFLVVLLPMLLTLPVWAREVELNWEPFDKALGYQIFISKSADFKDIVFKKVTKKPGITTKLDVGVYFYKVRAVDKDKQPGYWSEPMKFNVDPYPPELLAPKHDVDFGYYEIANEIEFTWKPLEDNPEYEIFIYKTTGQKVFEQKTKETKVGVKSLLEGEYMWKVRTIYKDIYESPYGEPRRFTVERKDLVKPELVKPAKDQDVPAYTSAQFEWTRDPVMKFTDVSISYVDDDSGEKKVIEAPKNLEEQNTWTLDNLEPGEYTWSVLTKEGPKSTGLSSETNTFKARKDLVSAENYGFHYGLGYITLSETYKSAQYSSNDSLSSSGFAHYLSGHYYLNENVGLQLDTRFAKLMVGSFELPYSEWTLSTRLRIGTPGFNQQIIFGYRQMNAFSVIKSPDTYTSYTTTGPVFGLQFNGTITSKWRMNLDALYFKPVSTQESQYKLTGDVYDFNGGFGYNISYKFWISYEFRYQKGVYMAVPKGNPDTVNTRWDNTILTPVMIKVGFEN